MLGGVIALHYKTFISLIRNHFTLITGVFLLSASVNAAVFYRHFYKWNMDLEDIVNTLQQLSLYGLTYTVAALFFFVLFWKNTKTRNCLGCKNFPSVHFNLFGSPLHYGSALYSA